METCLNKFATPDERKQHCIEQHKFSQKFQFWDCKPPRNLDSNKKKGKSKTSEKHSTKANSKTKQTLKSTLADSSTTTKGFLMEVDQEKSTDGVVVGASSDFKSQQVKKNEDQTKSNTNRGGNNNASRSMPKHIGFGRAPHRAFSNAYASAINPSKGKMEMGSSSTNGNNIDMKDIEEALVSSSSATKITLEVQADGTK